MISEEEYEILKSLDERWEWMARDSGSNRVGNLFAYSGKPFKYDVGLWNCGRGVHRIDNNLFQFIKWEDDDPHNIAELIEEYEDESEEREQKFYVLNSEGEAIPYDDLVQSIQWEDEEPCSISELVEEYEKESEETEVKRNLKEAILGIEITQFDGQKADLEELVNPRQLEEIINDWMPEVLSQEWINKHVETIFDLDEDFETEFIKVDDLQNLLVPKQEEVDRAYKAGYETGKQHSYYKGYLEGLADKESINPERSPEVDQHKELLEELNDLYARKNQDYGNSFDESLDEDGLLVLKIRLGDKYKRFSTLINQKNEVIDESMRDTLIDLANYALMGVMWIDQQEED